MMKNSLPNNRNPKSERETNAAVPKNSISKHKFRR